MVGLIHLKTHYSLIEKTPNPQINTIHIEIEPPRIFKCYKSFSRMFSLMILRTAWFYLIVINLLFIFTSYNLRIAAASPLGEKTETFKLPRLFFIQS